MVFLSFCDSLDLGLLYHDPRKRESFLSLRQHRRVGKVVMKRQAVRLNCGTVAFWQECVQFRSRRPCNGGPQRLFESVYHGNTQSIVSSSSSRVRRPKGGSIMSNPRTYAGSCFSGAAQFTVAGERVGMGYCHCRSCRHWSAGPVNAFTLWKPDAMKITKGAENIGTYNQTPQSYRKWCKT